MMVFFSGFFDTLVPCWVECLSRSSVGKQYECLCLCVFLKFFPIITCSAVVAVCTLLFQHPGICLLKGNFTILYILFGEKIDKVDES